MPRSSASPAGSPTLLATLRFTAHASPMDLSRDGPLERKQDTKGRSYFTHPQIDGEVNAVFLVSFYEKEPGKPVVCLVEEDDPVDWKIFPANKGRPKGERFCIPKLSFKGGKVERGDADPLATVVREGDQETGGLMPLIDRAHLLHLISRFEGFVKYLKGSKALFIFNPVPPEHLEEWLALPEAYYKKFQGTVDPSAERSATRVHLVPCPLTFVGMEKVGRLVAPPHECEIDCARRCCRHLGDGLCFYHHLEDKALLSKDFVDPIVQLLPRRCEGLVRIAAANPPKTSQRVADHPGN